MKMMQKKNKKQSGESSTDSEDGELNNGDPDLTGITKMRKKFRGKPEVFLKEFAASTKTVRTLGPGQTNKDEAGDEEETPAVVPKKKGT